MKINMNLTMMDTEVINSKSKGQSDNSDRQ